MFRPLSLFLGLRYSKASKGKGFISFISFISMIGIALGVTVLITVLSVMNGFDEEIHKRFFSMAAEVTVQDWDGKLANWMQISKNLMQDSKTRATAPYVGGQGLIVNRGQVLPIILTGVDLKSEEKFNEFSKKIVQGSTDGFHNFGVILGKELAMSIGANLGDMITIMVPQASSTPLGMLPRFKRFKVIAIFSAGTGFNFDAKMAFIDLENAQTFFQIKDFVTGIKIKLDHIDSAPEFAFKWQKKLGDTFQVGSWTQQFGEFFHAVKLEKNMMFLVLALIIAVACFNLVASLVMIVNDRKSQIAILRTLGLTPWEIIKIFVIQGTTIGFFGTLIGIVLGLILANHVTEIVDYLQSFFNISLVSANIYFVDFLPSKIYARDICNVAILSVAMSLISTIYPAWQASRILIVEGLHRES